MKSLAILGLFAFTIFASSCSRSDKTKQTDQNYIMGQSKMEVKDYKGAVSAFSRCIQINPNNYDAYHQRALAYKAMDNKKLALSNYKMAQRIMEKHEDLTDPNKKAEYQSLLEEIKDYTTAPDDAATAGTPVPGSYQPAGNNPPAGSNPADSTTKE